MKRTFWRCLCALAGTGMMVGIAFAQPGPGHAMDGMPPHGHGHEYMVDDHHGQNFMHNDRPSSKYGRDDYDTKTALANAQLKSKKHDLMRSFYSGPINLDAIDKILADIGKLEGEIWRHFTRHMKALEEIITPEQRAVARRPFLH